MACIQTAGTTPDRTLVRAHQHLREAERTPIAWRAFETADLKAAKALDPLSQPPGRPD